jgi:hypothetical protein
MNHSVLGAFAELRKTTTSFLMSVRLSAWNNSAPLERTLVKFDTCVFFDNLLRNFKFH